MAAVARKRSKRYVGPGPTITREDLARLEATGEWVFEEKKDGFWCEATVKDGIIVEMISRTDLAFEGAEVAGLLGREFTGKGAGRVIGELTADRTAEGDRCGTRQLHLFDIVEWNGLDLRSLKQTDRREALVMVYQQYCAMRNDTAVIQLIEQRLTGAVAFFDEILAKPDGEGIVAKRKDTLYRAANGDGKIESWVRAKKRRTVDYVVMGHGVAEKGTPNLDLGLFVVPKVGARDQRAKLTKILTITLPGAWYKLGDLTGQVVEAAGWEVFASGALRSAQLGHRAGPRTDKQPSECTLEAALEA